MSFCKNKLLFYCLLLLLFIFGCTGKKETLNPDVEKIEIDISKAKAVDITDIFDVVDFVPLETKKKCLLGNPRKMHINKMGYYFVDKNKVKVYDTKGKFKFVLDKIGRGPGEYIGIANINVSENSDTITIYDRIGRKIVNYDGEGNFVDQQFTNLFAVDCIKITDDLICSYIGALKQNLTDKRINFYSKSLNKLTNSFIPITKYEQKSDHFGQSQNFVKGDSCFYFSHLYFDTIYKITENKLKPAFVVDFGSNAVPKGFKQQSFNDVMHMVKAIDKDRYMSFNTPDFTKRYAYMSCSQVDDVYHAIYNIKTKRTTVIKKFVLSPFDEIDFDLKGFYPFVSDSEYFYYLIEPNLIIEKIDEIKKILSKERWVVFCSMYPKLIELYKKIDIFDNSIIVKVKIKNL